MNLEWTENSSYGKYQWDFRYYDLKYFTKTNCHQAYGETSSLLEVFCKKDVLRNSQNSQENICAIFLNEVASLPPTLLKKRLWHGCCLPLTFAKILRTTFIIEHLWWLLLEKKDRDKNLRPIFVKCWHKKFA